MAKKRKGESNRHTMTQKIIRLICHLRYNEKVIIGKFDEVKIENRFKD